MKIFVYDITGFKVADKPRCDYLLALLREKNVAAEKWTADAALNIKPDETVILAHSSDLLNSVERQFHSIAEAGALVVFYSAGGNINEEEVTLGSGWLYKRYWHSITEAFSSAPANFELQDFKSILDHPTQNVLFIALAILSWCISAPVNNKTILRRRKEWRNSPKKWQEVFSGITEERFLQAFNSADHQNQEWPPDTPELERLIKWIAPGSDSQPSDDSVLPLPAEVYTKALEQINRHFGWKL